MTFLMGSQGHEHFFRTKEHVFDIREAYAMTVTTFGPGVCYDVKQSRMAEQFAFFKDGLSDKAFVKYIDLIQQEVERYFTTEWGNEGEADLLQSLSDVFTLTSSRCLLGEEIRKRWKDSGMAEHYCKFCEGMILLFVVCEILTLLTVLIYRYRRHVSHLLTSSSSVYPLPKQLHWIILLYPFCSFFHGFPILIAPSVSTHGNCLKESLPR